MGEISELHTQSLKERKKKVQSLESDLRFCEDVIHKERLRGAKLKKELSTASSQYDSLLQKVRRFIAKNPNETVKIQQLISMLDEEHRKEFETNSIGTKVQFLKQESPLIDWSA